MKGFMRMKEALVDISVLLIHLPRCSIADRIIKKEGK